jgi:hypothetical protein
MANGLAESFMKNLSKIEHNNWKDELALFLRFEKVLVQQNRSNKSVARFDHLPYVIVEIRNNMAIAQCEHQLITRNKFKKYVNPTPNVPSLCVRTSPSVVGFFDSSLIVFGGSKCVLPQPSTDISSPSNPVKPIDAPLPAPYSSDSNLSEKGEELEQAEHDVSPKAPNASSPIPVAQPEPRQLLHHTETQDHIQLRRQE